MSEVPVETPALGFAECAFATTPLGLGTPGLPGSVPAPGDGSRFLNPQSRDWEIDPATTQLAQMPPTRQRVLLALLTVRGSATAVPGFGFTPPTKIGALFEAQTRNAVRTALRHLTNEEAPVISIDNIDVVKVAPGRVVLTVEFTDLATSESDEVSI